MLQAILQEVTMRIQFDLDDRLIARLERYVGDMKMRHFVAHQALEEWINRKEGRDKKLQMEQFTSNMELLRPFIEEIFRKSLPTE